MACTWTRIGDAEPASHDYDDMPRPLYELGCCGEIWYGWGFVGFNLCSKCDDVIHFTIPEEGAAAR